MAKAGLMTAPVAGYHAACSNLYSEVLLLFIQQQQLACVDMQGGFQADMTKREAALILGLRESAAAEKVKEAHRRIMIANHPDSGGSSFLATKVNEAKDMMLGKGKRLTNIF